MDSELNFSNALEAWFRMSLGKGMKLLHSATQIEVQDTDGAFWPYGYADIAGWYPLDDTFQLQHETVANSDFVWGIGCITNRTLIEALQLFQIGDVFSFNIYLVDFLQEERMLRGIDLEQSAISLFPTINSQLLNMPKVDAELASVFEMERVRFATLDWSFGN